ncbi:STY4534 family ICE replication protein [Pseudomonas sp. 21LCFQ010]|uniref:STY4534 family ICE replication protein n=1 Tax=Pseudomonas sp. 21LCFQ010 TaxID=2957506 RepID=UPI0020968B6D|nr:STY4534 family ICE replication protein [Pseudomonas sp. 21LCFQ010]MCO8163864.1 STY4534 family ICE replication protein [Pseudomonas sp. 21LCFQ010]
MTQTTTPTYFDLHTSGIGYLNRIREVEVRKGAPFMAVTVAALHGSSEQAEYTYIDCKVAGGEAENLVRRCQQAEAANRKVLVGFRIGDIRVETFTYERGPKKGQTGASLKGRLLFISWIKINGEYAYQAPQKESGQSAHANPHQDSSAEAATYHETQQHYAAEPTYAAPRPAYNQAQRPQASRPMATRTADYF